MDARLVARTVRYGAGSLLMYTVSRSDTTRLLDPVTMNVTDPSPDVGRLTVHFPMPLDTILSMLLDVTIPKAYGNNVDDTDALIPTVVSVDEVIARLSCKNDNVSTACAA